MKIVISSLILVISLTSVILIGVPTNSNEIQPLSHGVGTIT